jgi:dihydropyrimidinase
MAYKGAVMVDDTTLFRVMRQAHDKGAVVMVHAENGDAIDVLVKEAQAKKQTAPKYHATTRPPETEGEATNRAIQLAHIADAALYVVHVSCKQAIDPIAIARENNWNIHGETCPQYLFFDESYLDKPNFEGAKWIYTPPPRAKEHQEHLWHALDKNVLSVISTDHCPFNWKGQKTLGRKDFALIPNGGVGIEDRVRLIHHYGVRTGRISLNRMVDLLCAAPARYFGLYPRKGTVAVGADAPQGIVDPRTKWTISKKTSHCLADHNLYEGRTVTGTPTATLVRGKVVVEDNKLVATPGHGQYIKRANYGSPLVSKGR